MRLHHAITTLLLAATAACNPNDDKVFKEGGNAELKPIATAIANAGGSDLLEKPASEAASVTYVVHVKSNSGSNLCDGEVSISIFTDFTIKVPGAKLQCVSMSVDLAGVLGSGLAAGGGADKSGNLTHDGKMLNIKTMGTATFDPPRPFLIGPVVQDPAKYKGFNRTTDHSISGTDPTSGQAVNGSGSFTVEVLDEQTQYKNAYVTEPFKNIMHWQVKTKGFDGIAARNGLLFDKWEWYWNTRPIMIPQIEIVGLLSDFIEAKSGSEDQLVGKLTIQLIVKDYDLKDGNDQ